jgi:hypothetical protein
MRDKAWSLAALAAFIGCGAWGWEGEELPDEGRVSLFANQDAPIAPVGVVAARPLAGDVPLYIEAYAPFECPGTGVQFRSAWSGYAVPVRSSGDHGRK